MLHPPPPIFSHADVTEQIFGSVATNLRRMGAPIFRLKKLTCGSEHAVGVTVDGAVIGFGSNYFGQLGETSNGSDQGPRFADESHVGPRTARMYPNVDCSSVSGKLNRQYYESAVLLKPPSLKRSPLVIAQAYAQYKGRTVEFNDVVNIVSIPDRMAQSQQHQQNRRRGSSPTSLASDNSIDEISNEDSFNSYESYDEEEDDDESYDQPPPGMMKRGTAGGPLARKATVFAGKTSPTNNAASRKALLAKINAQAQMEDNDQDDDDDDDDNKNKNHNDKLRAVTNPSWPADTVVVVVVIGSLYY